MAYGTSGEATAWLCYRCALPLTRKGEYDSGERIYLICPRHGVIAWNFTTPRLLESPEGSG